MRALVQLEEEERARDLGDALFAEGIDCRVDASREGGFIVWVHDEAHMDEARRILELYRASPDDPRFREAAKVAEARRKERAAAEKKSRHRSVDVRKRWREQGGWGRLTLALVIASVGVTALAGTLLPGAHENLEVVAVVAFDWDRVLRHYEVWRIVTPIFLHFGLIHIFFNMWMLRYFGAAVEHRHSTLTLGVMVLVMGGLSNLAQAFFTMGLFGGMSGVIYGLFAYLWIRGRLDPRFGIAIPRSTVIVLLAWMVLGFVGFLNMANMAHLGGLVVGAIWGFLSSGWLGRNLR